MIHNLYLTVVVICRALALWFVASAVIALVFSTLMGRGAGLAIAVGLIPTFVGGVCLWLLAKRIALLVTRDLE